MLIGWHNVPTRFGLVLVTGLLITVLGSATRDVKTRARNKFEILVIKNGEKSFEKLLLGR